MSLFGGEEQTYNTQNVIQQTFTRTANDAFFKQKIQNMNQQWKGDQFKEMQRKLLKEDTHRPTYKSLNDLNKRAEVKKKKKKYWSIVQEIPWCIFETLRNLG